MKRDSDKDKYYIVRHLLHFRSLHKFASKGDFYPLKRGGLFLQTQKLQETLGVNVPM